VPDIEQDIHLVVAVVIFLSLLPAIVAWARERMRGGAARRVEAAGPDTTGGKP